MEIQQIELGCRFQKQNQFKKGGKGKKEEKRPRTAEGRAARQECVCVFQGLELLLFAQCAALHMISQTSFFLSWSVLAEKRAPHLQLLDWRVGMCVYGIHAVSPV